MALAVYGGLLALLLIFGATLSDGAGGCFGELSGEGPAEIGGGGGAPDASPPEGGEGAPGRRGGIRFSPGR